MTTRNATAELQHGRQGGGWIPKAKLVEEAHVMHVPAKAGPLDGYTLAMHHWGPTAKAPDLVPVHAHHGQYRLTTQARGGPIYRWETTRA